MFIYNLSYYIQGHGLHVPRPTEYSIQLINLAYGAPLPGLFKLTIKLNQNIKLSNYNYKNSKAAAQYSQKHNKSCVEVHAIISTEMKT